MILPRIEIYESMHNKSGSSVCQMKVGGSRPLLVSIASSQLLSPPPGIGSNIFSCFIMMFHGSRWPQSFGRCNEYATVQKNIKQVPPTSWFFFRRLGSKVFSRCLVLVLMCGFPPSIQTGPRPAKLGELDWLPSES